MRIVGRLWALSLALIVVGSLAALSVVGFREDPARAPNIVLVSIDSLRADHTTPYGYRAEFTQEATTPFLKRLADEGVLFEHASADSSWTLPSRITLLTGMHSREHGVRTGGERLAAAGTQGADRPGVG